MSITTYTELKAALADWLLRDDLTAVLPTFISLAEADINRRVRHWRMEERATLSISGQFTDLPAGFLEVAMLTLSSSRPVRMELISRGEMQDRREINADTTGVPQYYALTGGQIEVYPTPNDTYSANLVYIAAPTALSDANADNWLLTYHPDIYLYGALLQAAPYLKDDERVGLWGGLFNAAIEAANVASDKARFSGTTPRLKIRSY